MNADRAIDEAEIRNVIGTYAQTVDDRRFDELRAILADGFTFDIGGDVIDGADAFVDRLSSRPAPDHPRAHITSNPVIHIEADGQRARATVDLLYVGKTDDDSWTILTRSRYDDALLKSDGRWVFVSRRVRS
jgi:3-phenylpropionate/cinnamic acid dioxygenase small subunit